MFAFLFGVGVAAFSLGALNQRITDRDDLLAEHFEAILLGLAFALASVPRGWAIFARAALPVPIFFVYLSVFLGRNPPLPFYAAFAMAGCYSLFFTALAAHFSERPSET